MTQREKTEEEAVLERALSEGRQTSQERDQTTQKEVDLHLFRLATSLYLTFQLMNQLSLHLLGRNQLSQTSTSQRTLKLMRKTTRMNKRLAKKWKNLYAELDLILPYVPEVAPSVLSKLEQQVIRAARAPENYGTPSDYENLRRRIEEVVNL